jgi:hypothetical protein
VGRQLEFLEARDVETLVDPPCQVPADSRHLLEHLLRRHFGLKVLEQTETAGVDILLYCTGNFVTNAGQPP